MYNTVENIKFTGLSATPAAFTLRGGNYGVTIGAGTWGTATLQRLAADGTTYVTVLTAFSANGYQNVNLPSGTYQLLLAGAATLSADITAVVTTL